MALTLLLAQSASAGLVVDIWVVKTIQIGSLPPEPDALFRSTAVETEGVAEVVSTFSPPGVPFQGLTFASHNSAMASASYDGMTDGLWIDFLHSLGPEAAWALSDGELHLEVTAPIEYEISGEFAAMSSAGTGLHLEILLFDETANETLFYNKQWSAAANSSFDVGGLEGDDPMLEGSLTGTLLPEHVYALEWLYLLEDGSTSGASAVGDFHFMLVPEPATGTAVLVGLIGLVLGRRERSALRSRSHHRS